MFKGIGGVLLLLINSCVFACSKALPVENPNFCSSFKKAATCHCTSSGMPSGMCEDMKVLYNHMIGMFGSLKNACTYQHDTTIQNCMDSWNCYRLGGVSSQGNWCSATKKACP